MTVQVSKERPTETPNFTIESISTPSSLKPIYLTSFLPLKITYVKDDLIDFFFLILSVTVNIKRLSHLAPSSGISIVWRADSWCQRHAMSRLSALQTMEMPLDGANTADS